MTKFQTIATLAVITALLSYLNHKYFRLPKTIGLMFASLGVSFAIMVVDALGFNVVVAAAKALGTIDFSEMVLEVVLSFLLFAGALHIDIHTFWRERWAILSLAVLGTIISTALIGAGTYYVLSLLGYPLPLAACLLFGALISPTDPISVLALLKQGGVPANIEMKVAGEALLNDGVGVVLFITLLGAVTGTHAITFGTVSKLLLLEVVGGIGIGLVLGYATYHLLKRIDDYNIEILLSIALVVGGYALANALHASGPLAMVAAGLLIGNRGRALAMSETTRNNLDLFWEVVDDILNAALFVLVGFEALLLTLKLGYLYAGLSVIPLVLSARFVSVWISSRLVGISGEVGRHSAVILTWGGLRGGISLALALALPHESGRDVLLFITYVVVVFSTLVQGLTFRRVLDRIGT